MNSQLQKILDVAPISSEDKHNFATIFASLHEEKKIEILAHPERYIERMLVLRKKIDEERRLEIVAALRQANTFMDEALEQLEQKKQKTIATQKNTQEELITAGLYKQ